MWKTYNEKNIPYSLRGGFRLNSKRKLSETWNKFIKFQRKCFVEQPTGKLKKMLLSTRIKTYRALA